LSCDIVEALGTAIQQVSRSFDLASSPAWLANYFSTQGCSLVLSSFWGAFEAAALLFAAAAARALLSKKFAMGDCG